MTDQLDLFDTPGLARTDDPETSSLAAAISRRWLKATIMLAFRRNDGLTDDELVEQVKRAAVEHGLEKVPHAPSIKTARSALTKKEGTVSALAQQPIEWAGTHRQSNAGAWMRVWRLREGA